jgi:hypothetical protein
VLFSAGSGLPVESRSGSRRVANNVIADRRCSFLGLVDEISHPLPLPASVEAPRLIRSAYKPDPVAVLNEGPFYPTAPIKKLLLFMSFSQGRRLYSPPLRLYSTQRWTFLFMDFRCQSGLDYVPPPPSGFTHPYSWLYRELDIAPISGFSAWV